jgi:uncharacterized RDD family membrane protein YckC
MQNTVKVKSAQNVRLNFTIAGIGERIVATLIDSIIIGLIAILVFNILPPFASIAENTVLIILYILFSSAVFIYDPFFEIIWNGQTPGKRIRGIKVITVDGTRPTIGAFLLRWITRPVEIVMSFGIIAMVAIFLNKKGQRIGDIAAGTIIVKIPERVSISQTVLKKIDSSYSAMFPQVAYLDDQTITTVQKVINAYTANRNMESYKLLVEKTKDKMEEKLSLQSDLPAIEFLYTIVKDYNYFHQDDDISAGIGKKNAKGLN